MVWLGWLRERAAILGFYANKQAGSCIDFFSRQLISRRGVIHPNGWQLFLSLLRGRNFNSLYFSHSISPYLSHTRSGSHSPALMTSVIYASTNTYHLNGNYVRIGKKAVHVRVSELLCEKQKTNLMSH